MMWILCCQLKYVAIEYLLKKLPQNGQNLGMRKMRNSGQARFGRISTTSRQKLMKPIPLDSPGPGESFCQLDHRSISNIQRVLSWQQLGTIFEIFLSFLSLFCYFLTND
jgi:hypothetical protein